MKYAFSLSVLSILAAVTPTARAAESTSPQASQTAIAPQPLGDALEQWAVQNGKQLMFDADLAAGKTTRGAAAGLSEMETLSRLLDGTGLVYRVLNDRTISIFPRDGAANAVGTSTAMPALSTSEVDDRDPVHLAQSDASAENSSSQADASSDANAADQETSLQEVIVTAQKRAERLQDVPISVSVLSGFDLDRDSSRGVSDVLNQVGGVSVFDLHPGETKITIRGVAADPFVGTSTAGYYLDEIPFSFISIVQLPDANAYDLSRVEVLRGPQGTLYGANALSGVVRVLTQDAELDEFKAKARVRASNTKHGTDNHSGDLAINVPLVPGKLAVRGVASYSQYGGNITSAEPGGALTNRINDSEAQSYRLKATYHASENLSIKLGLTRSMLDNGAYDRSYADMTTPFSANQGDERQYDAYNLIAEYAWPAFSLLSSTGYVDYSADTNEEGLLSLDPRFALNFLNSWGLRSFSQELRLSSHLSGPWQWSVGAIYKDTTQEHLQLALLFSPQPFIEDTASQSYAVFGETTRSLADGRFAVTGGLRYFSDRLVSQELSNFFGPGTSARRSDFDQVTGRVVLTYKPQTDRMLYGAVATGFRSGQHNGTFITGLYPQFNEIKPDSLTTYELGIKSAVAQGAFTYDASVYYTDWKDIQQGLVVPPGFVAGLNAGKADGLGADVSMAYRPVGALVLQANLGWNALEYAQDILVTDSDNNSVVLFPKGTRLNNSAEWTGSVGGTFRAASPFADADWIVSTNYVYRSRIDSRALNRTLVSVTQSDALRSLKASVGLERQRWSVNLYGDNLLNNLDPITPPDALYDGTSVRQRPRTIGLQATFQY
jgi:iron complex outermembrane recepter protein